LLNGNRIVKEINKKRVFSLDGGVEDKCFEFGPKLILFMPVRLVTSSGKYTSLMGLWNSEHLWEFRPLW